MGVVVDVVAQHKHHAGPGPRAEERSTPAAGADHLFLAVAIERDDTDGGHVVVGDVPGEDRPFGFDCPSRAGQPHRAMFGRDIQPRAEPGSLSRDSSFSDIASASYASSTSPVGTNGADTPESSHMQRLVMFLSNRLLCGR